MEKVKLDLTIQQVNIILAGLGKLPLEQAIEMFQEVHKQVREQTPQGPLADKVIN